METYDVVVVGAGIAGLVAARQIQRAGLSVAVLEARDRVGGRTLNHRLASGAVIEVGGQWIGPGQTHVLDLVRSLGLELFESYEEGDNQSVRNGEVVRWTNQDNSYGLTEKDLVEVRRLQAELEHLATTIPLDSPWLAPDAEMLDAQTLETWLVTAGASDAVLSWWRTIVAALFSAETWQMSMLHFLFYIRGAGLIDIMMATAGGAQEHRVRGGSQRIALELAERMGDAVRLGSPVVRIERGAGCVVVQRANGSRIEATKVIVAVPPVLAGRIAYSPPLPADRDQLTQQFPMGYVIKTQAVYPEPFWREEGLSGFTVTLDDAVSVTFDNSPEDGSCGVLIAFVEGERGRALGNLPSPERQAAVVESMSRYFGPRALNPIEFVEQNWAEEEFSRGCYGGRLGTGVWTSLGPALRAAVGPIHWAGTETAETWNGYMDGAVSSGERAAREVIAAHMKSGVG